MINRRVVFALALLAISGTAAAADPAERKFIRQGMSEGEVLMKVGKPDSESIDSGGGAKVTVKRWIYLPTSGDQQTITTVVLQNGKVTDVERKVSF